MTRTIPREKTARIVSDLAKGFRSIGEIARINGESVDVIEGLRDAYGPSLGSLAQAAEELRRRPVVVAEPPGHKQAPEVVQDVAEPIPAPVVAAASEPEPPVEVEAPAPAAVSRTPYHDGLTSEERRLCRVWATVHHPAWCLTSRGALSRQLVDAWTDAGRPTVDAPPPPANDDPWVGVDVPAPLAKTDPALDRLVDPDDPVSLDVWIARARQQPALHTWVERYDLAFCELAAAWLEHAADALALVEQRTRELDDAKAAAALLAPPVLRTRP